MGSKLLKMGLVAPKSFFLILIAFVLVEFTYFYLGFN